MMLCPPGRKGLATAWAQTTTTWAGAGFLICCGGVGEGLGEGGKAMLGFWFVPY